MGLFRPEAVARAYEIAHVNRGPWETVRAAHGRTLPARYTDDIWDRRFRTRLSALVQPGIAILDVGAGRRPTLPLGDRPVDIRYVGLDVDETELASAPVGSYDETAVAPVERELPGFVGRFDLIVSFLAFEHVQSTATALENIRRYLRPGGVFLAQLAGGRSPSAVANRLLPERLARELLGRTQGRPPESVFPAKYDDCSYGGLTALLSEGWAEREVIPLFSGVGYVLFSRVLTAAYIAYEEWAYRKDRKDLATYYLIEARR